MSASMHKPRDADAMTVEQALDSASEAELSEVVIIGHDHEGQFFVRSSSMERKDALWLAEKLREYALNGGSNG